MRTQPKPGPDLWHGSGPAPHAAPAAAYQQQQAHTLLCTPRAAPCTHRCKGVGVCPPPACVRQAAGGALVEAAAAAPGAACVCLGLWVAHADRAVCPYCQQRLQSRGTRHQVKSLGQGQGTLKCRVQRCYEIVQ